MTDVDKLRGTLGPLYTNPKFAESLIGKDVIGIIGPSSNSCEIEINASSIFSLKSPKNRLVTGKLVAIKDLQSPFYIQGAGGDYLCKGVREVIKDPRKERVALVAHEIASKLKALGISLEDLSKEFNRLDFQDLESGSVWK